MVMHHFYSLSPSTVSHLEDDFRRVISDKDPGVMEAALILFHDMITVSLGLRGHVKCICGWAKYSVNYFYLMILLLKSISNYYL